MKETVLALFLAGSRRCGNRPNHSQACSLGLTPFIHAASTVIRRQAWPRRRARGRGELSKTAFTLRYQDIKLGTGADAEPNKLYKVLYTGYLGATGVPMTGKV